MSLSQLKLDNDVEQAADVLGGGGAKETGIYPFTVKHAYMHKSAGGALGISVRCDDGSGGTFDTTQWVASGDAKGNKPYYERNGKKYPLPGYSIIDDMCQLGTDVALADMDTEEKTIKLYDFDEQKEVPTEVDMLVDLVGANVYLAIQKCLVDKTEENPNFDDSKREDKISNPKRIPTGETREENEVSKVFEASSKLTAKEIADNVDECVFFDKWLAKNEGKVRDKTSKDAKKTGTAKAGSPKKKMFG